MTLKGWMLGKVNGTVRPDRPGDASRRSADPSNASGTDPREPGLHAPVEARDRAAENAAYLGPYRPLIMAIREELEHFAESQLRLHLAIAERDRYVLTSIQVECEGSDDHRELLRRFVAEFKPEQIKRYLAREVIAGLRNASAIDLTQFAGMDVMNDPGDKDEEDGYAELLAELRAVSPSVYARPYHVTLTGRWSQTDAPTAPSGVARLRTDDVVAERAHTPLAGRTILVDVEDRAGNRRMEIASVVPGRRYVVGKDEHCDIVVDGMYASRRHCEIWFDQERWWVADSASTNGIRIEADSVHRLHRSAPAGAHAEAVPLPPGAWIVLSAHAQGDSSQYPRIALRPSPAPEHGGIARDTDERATPATPIAPPRRRPGTLTIAAHMASGIRHADIAEDVLPFRVGRSRNQELVIDWSHSEVSGRHIEIVALDEGGASVVVHGDNGVTVDGKPYEPGARFRWKPGENLLLGRSEGPSPGCSLTMSSAK